MSNSLRNCIQLQGEVVAVTEQCGLKGLVHSCCRAHDSYSDSFWYHHVSLTAKSTIKIATER